MEREKKMLFGESTSATDKVLSMMRESTFEFHCTGSRFLGTNSGTSDYDFFVKNDSIIETWLKNIGFIQQFDSQYNDCSCIALYSLKNVDVQIIRQEYFPAKIIVNRLLKENIPYFYSKLRNRGERQHLWEILIKMAHSIMSQ